MAAGATATTAAIEQRRLERAMDGKATTWKSIWFGFWIVLWRCRWCYVIMVLRTYNASHSQTGPADAEE